MRRLALLLLVIGACAADDGNQPPGPRRCEFLEGKVFASVTEGECGLGPNGPVPCTWHLTFTARDATSTSYDWQHSDYGQSGAVSCDQYTVADTMTQAPHGTYDPDSGQLVWDDVAYAGP